MLNTTSRSACFTSICIAMLGQGFGSPSWAGTLAQDRCADASLVEAGTTFAITTTAGNESSVDCADSSDTPDIFYRYEATQDCLLEVDTCGSNYDAVVSLHDACPDAGGAMLACGDDVDCDGDGGVADDGFAAAASQLLTAGSNAIIRVSGRAGQRGAVTLNVSCSPLTTDDVCTDVTDIATGPLAGSTIGNTRQTRSSCAFSSRAADAWYRFTPPDNCTLSLTLRDSIGFDALLAVYSACPADVENELACAVLEPADPTLELDVVAGAEHYIRVGGGTESNGLFAIDVACSSGKADIVVGELDILEQFGRAGDVFAAHTQSTVCNGGDQPLDWFPLEDGRHPVMMNNLYRLEDDRLEHIGWGWLKHGFASAQQDDCGFGCEEWPDMTRTGVGCSDTYSATTNANREFMGPRHEVNPWTGDFSFDGSYLDLNITQVRLLDDIEHRMQVHDDDIDPDLHPDARFFIELLLAARDDRDPTDSAGWEEVRISGGQPGGTWVFDIGSSETQIGPAIEAWSGARRTTIPQDTVDDGRCILSAKASDNGDGTWHYEYALYNLDMDRQVRGFEVPVGTATVTNIGFHAPDKHSDLHNDLPWPATVADGRITWSTGPFGEHPDTNPLRWGSLVNFRFDADQPAVDTSLLLHLYKPGSPEALAGVTIGPAAAGCLRDSDCADHDANGIRDDGCIAWSCAGGTCSATATVFGDIGGVNGACTADGAANDHDRLHALNCFSNSTTQDALGFPCESNAPHAVHADAAGDFGNCAPDGICDTNDAFAAMDAFAGQSSCACPRGSASADGLPPVRARAEIVLVPRRSRVRPGEDLVVDALLATAVDELRGYQLHAASSGGRSGVLELTDMAIASPAATGDPTASDVPIAAHVFDGLPTWSAFNVASAQLAAGLDSGTTTANKYAYLASFTFSTQGALGTFTVDLLADAADRSHRTFLFPSVPTQRIELHISPATVRVGGIRRGDRRVSR